MIDKDECKWKDDDYPCCCGPDSIKCTIEAATIVPTMGVIVINGVKYVAPWCEIAPIHDAMMGMARQTNAKLN